VLPRCGFLPPTAFQHAIALAKTAKLAIASPSACTSFTIENEALSSFPKTEAGALSTPQGKKRSNHPQDWESQNNSQRPLPLCSAPPHPLLSFPQSPPLCPPYYPAPPSQTFFLLIPARFLPQSLSSLLRKADHFFFLGIFARWFLRKSLRTHSPPITFFLLSTF